ncbi:MAG: translation initiation factor [Myxococcota bacterium]
MSKSLAELMAEAGFQASGGAEPESADSAAPEPAATDPVSFGPKVVVRSTRKGRGGRTVTVVQGVRTGIDDVCAALKRQVGVGVRREGHDVVLQGDQRDRVARWLEAQGVKKVVRG